MWLQSWRNVAYRQTGLHVHQCNSPVCLVKSDAVLILGLRFLLNMCQFLVRFRVEVVISGAGCQHIAYWGGVMPVCYYGNEKNVLFLSN